METKIYIFSLDYGNRMEEKEFIKAVLREFDSNTLVGCGIFVNNNPYCLELLFFASLEKDTDRFEDFMKKHFNDKQRVFNYFFDDIIESFYKRGYNVKTFIEADEVDFIITDEPNGLFLFPSKEIVNKTWESNREIKRTPKVFLSHSSKDKEIVDEIHRIESVLDGRGRVLIRPSGTEPLVRVMLEGENQEEIDKLAHNLANMILEKVK